jgi:glycosyltransferase involved in cell wall biosynthesis
MLARGLAERGHAVWLGCREESLLYQLLADSQVKRVAMRFKGKMDLPNAKAIASLVKAEQIQIINAQSSWDRYTSIWAKWLYVPQVKVVHTRRQRPLSSGGWLQNLIYNKGADGFVAVSHSVATQLKALGLKEEKIKVIFNGTPAEKYTGLSQSVSDALGAGLQLSRDVFTIGCISRKKQQEQLLAALVLLPFATQIIFVGIQRTELPEPLIRDAEKDGHTLYFLGEVSSHEVLHYYGLLDVSVLPSTMEGLSQSLLEAMALGVPVIATDAGGNPDLITHEHNGWLFEEGNVAQLASLIHSVKNEPEKLISVVANARARALESFSLSRTIEAYEEYFADLALPPAHSQ